MKECNLNVEQKESLAAFLLGALPARDAEALEAHFETGCSSCAQELGQLRELFAMLACSAAPASPSKAVRARLFARLAAEPCPDPPLKVRPVPWYRVSPWLIRVAASLIVMLVLGEAFYHLVEYKRRARQQEIQIAQLLEQIKKQQYLITSMSAGRRMIVLDGQLIKASGKAFLNTDENTWFFYIEKLPPAPKGKVYQVWFITGQQECVSGTAFQTDINGHSEFRLKTPYKASPIVATAVSLEPEGGSTQPQGAIYLSGPV